MLHVFIYEKTIKTSRHQSRKYTRLPPVFTRTTSGFGPTGESMLDLIMLAIGLGFFALSVAYGQICEQL